MGEEFPEATVMASNHGHVRNKLIRSTDQGADYVVPHFEDHVSLPRNVYYTFTDANKILHFPCDHFDLVYIRLLTGAVCCPISVRICCSS